MTKFNDVKRQWLTLVSIAGRGGTISGHAAGAGRTHVTRKGLVWRQKNKQIDISKQASVRGQEARIIVKSRPVDGDTRVGWLQTTPLGGATRPARDYHPLMRWCFHKGTVYNALPGTLKTISRRIVECLIRFWILATNRQQLSLSHKSQDDLWEVFLFLPTALGYAIGMGG